MPHVFGDSLTPGFNGNLTWMKYIAGGFHVVNTISQRNNNIPFLVRTLDGLESTVVYVTSVNMWYKLTNNPATDVTADTDWTALNFAIPLIATSGSGTTVNTVTGAVDINGNLTIDTVLYGPTKNLTVTSKFFDFYSSGTGANIGFQWHGSGDAQLVFSSSNAGKAYAVAASAFADEASLNSTNAANGAARTYIATRYNKISLSTGLAVAFDLVERMAIDTAGVWTINMGSDARGDMYVRNAAGNFVRLAIGAANRYLTGGTDPTWTQVSLTAGVTGILPLANGGVAVALSDPGAHSVMGWDDTTNAVRFFIIGAGLTYTQATNTLSSSGGGITNTAVNNEIPKSNGTNIVPSGLFSASLGDLKLGDTTTPGVTRFINAQGTTADISISSSAAGLGTYTITGNAITIGGGSFVTIAVGSTTIAGNESTGSGNAGGDVIILSGRGVTGNANSGNIFINTLAKAGSGIVGSISLFKQTADYGGGEKVLFFGDATTNPTTNPTGGGLMFVKSADHKPYWRTPAGVETVMLSGGAGITNTAANNEIPKSDGTNVIPSGIFSTSSGNITTGVWQGTPVGLAFGGTNTNLSASAAIGDLIQASSTTAFQRLASVATGNVLISGGVATLNSWGKVTSAHTDATIQVSGLSWLLASGGTLTGANTITGTTTNTLKYVFDNLGTTVTNGTGQWLVNSQPALVGAQTQISPSTFYEGRVWETTGGTSQTVVWAVHALPQPGTTANVFLRFMSSINGGAYSSAVQFLAGGTIYAGGFQSLNTNTQFFVRSLFTTSASATGAIRFYNTTAAFTATSGVVTGVGIGDATLGFRPTSGSATFNAVLLQDGVSLTGGASGQVIGVNANMTFAAAVNVTGFDWNPITPANITGTHLAWRNTSGAILHGGTTITAGSVLVDLQSTTLALLITRVTNVASVTTPVNGMIVYDAALNLFKLRENGAWVGVGGGGMTNPMTNIGDLIQGDTAGAPVRLADVAAGSWLRSGGVNTPVAWSTTTIPNTAAIGDLWQASASNVMSALTAVATGNVVISGGVGTISSWGKVGLTTHVSGILPLANGGTAANLTDPNAHTIMGWDDTSNAVRFFTIGSGLTYTQATNTLSASSGGGITNTAASGEIMKSDGTNAVPSGLFSLALGDLNLGSVSLSGNRALNVLSSTTNAGLTVQMQGTGLLALNSDFTYINTSAGIEMVLFDNTTSTALFGKIDSSAYTITRAGNAGTGGDLIILGSPGSVNIDSGNLYFKIGLASGTGKRGNIGLFTSSGTFGAGEQVVFWANATTIPSTNPTNGGIMFVKSADNKPYWRTPAGVEYSMVTGDVSLPAATATTDGYLLAVDWVRFNGLTSFSASGDVSMSVCLVNDATGALAHLPVDDFLATERNMIALLIFELVNEEWPIQSQKLIDFLDERIDGLDI